MSNCTNKCALLLLLFLALGLGGCNVFKPFIKNLRREERKEERKEKRAERNAVRGNLVTVVIDSAGMVKRDSLKLRANDTLQARALLSHRRIGYSTFQCKAKMHFESGDQKQNFTANFRLKKGEAIWVSINAPLVGEVARALITPDSVKAIERINKRSYLYSYRDIQKIINIEVDFPTLQDLIIGNAIATDGLMTDIKELGALTTFFIRGNDYTNQVTYNKADSTLKQLQLQTVRSVSTSSLLIAYQNYQLQQDRHFPALRSYHIQDVKGAAEVSMDINKFDFDLPTELPFAIPANYKPQR